MNQFLDKEWTLSVPVTDIIVNLQRENKRLEESNNALKKQVCFLTNKQQKEGAQDPWDITTRRKRQSLEEYSERHCRQLKRQRTSSCAASLAWMEQEGLTPVEIIVRSTQTNKLETIQVCVKLCVSKVKILARRMSMCLI